MYIYIYTYTYAYNICIQHVHLYMCISDSMCTRLYAFLCLHICMHACIYAYMYLRWEWHDRKSACLPLPGTAMVTQRAA